MLSHELCVRKWQCYIKINSGKKLISLVCQVTGLTSHLLCGGGTLHELSNYISTSSHIYFLCIDKANWTSETLSILPKVTKLVGTRAGHQKRIQQLQCSLSFHCVFLPNIISEGCCLQWKMVPVTHFLGGYISEMLLLVAKDLHGPNLEVAVLFCMKANELLWGSSLRLSTDPMLFLGTNGNTDDSTLWTLNEISTLKRLHHEKRFMKI